MFTQNFIHFNKVSWNIYYQGNSCIYYWFLSVNLDQLGNGDWCFKTCFSYPNWKFLILKLEILNFKAFKGITAGFKTVYSTEWSLPSKPSYCGWDSHVTGGCKTGSRVNTWYIGRIFWVPWNVIHDILKYIYNLLEIFAVPNLFFFLYW